MNTYPRVDLTYHADGNVGIGTPPDASAPLVMGEPVERIRFIMSNQEPEEHVFAHPTTEWARVDKDLNVTHLDMELCAKGPKNVYTALAMAIWNKAIETEREKVAQWMTRQGYATGHGDNIEDLLKELEWQIEDRIKNIIRTKTTYAMQNDLAESVEPDEESDK